MTIETVSEVRAVESAKYLEVLGVRFAAVQIPEGTRNIEEWIAKDRKTHYITVSKVHSVIECQRDVQFMETLNGSSSLKPCMEMPSR